MRILAAFPLALLPLASVAGAPAASDPEPAQAAGETLAAAAEPCERHLRPRFAVRSDRVRAERLIDLPPGNLDLAVMRSLDGCHEPVTIRENYGAVGGSRPARRPERPAMPRTRLLEK